MIKYKVKVGFIGLGIMGQAFTKCLVNGGFDVFGYDILSHNVEKAKKHGVIGTLSPKDTVNKSDVVLTSVTTTNDLERVVFGDKGVTKGKCNGKILIDFSTTSVPRTREMSEKLEQTSSMKWIDAPVSGGPDSAEIGELAILVGGDEKDILKVDQILQTVSARFTRFGSVGSGQVAKMVNQILVLNNFVIIAEALALAEAGGLDADKIPLAFSDGQAGSNLLNIAMPRMVSRDFTPKGYARQILKDLDSLHDLAKTLESPIPMSDHAASLYRILNIKGNGELDATAIFKLYDKVHTL